MKSTALLTGPYDWDPALLPRTEFEARLARVRSVMAAREVTGLVVHGDSAEHGSLAYLTGFTPKLGPAFAFVPEEGPLRLLVSGSASMLGAAKRLTWVEDVRALGDPRKSIGEWLRPLVGSEPGSLGLWGGRAMTRRIHLLLANATSSFAGLLRNLSGTTEPLTAGPPQVSNLSDGRSGPVPLLDLDNVLDALRRRKSPIEREMIVRACRSLTVANSVFAHAAAGGAGARSAAIEAERGAFRTGAQDFRILASARDGGPPLPFYGTADLAVRPVLVCMAVRFAGYWAEGWATISSAESGALAHASAALAARLEQARAGMSLRECSSIGLSLDEPSDSLEAGGVYTLRADAAGADNDNAVVSAMIAVGESGIEVLWPEASQWRVNP